MSQRWLDEENEILTEQETRDKIDQPRLFKVLLHNDNYTTMDFVVMILQRVFHKPEADAVRIMLDVHYKGIGIVGIYPREGAETKVELVKQIAQDAQFPLLCTMEPE
ncbi:MAG: ATP-dependent Clp protease adaptor ClpS [Chloroflexi bacterium]|nr:ATP-dependent Clp protease adaptor ClpS [Chloroflexota bacterium]